MEEKAFLENMRKVDVPELKLVQLEILNYVANFCKENNIRYWIDSGTLLGAIRHKGYIPWDDDIDIGMLRADYDKFRELFNKNADKKYRFRCGDDDLDFNHCYGKVMDTTTILYEPDPEKGFKESINIDVFVYDNAPNSNFKLKMKFLKRDFLRIMRSVQMDYKIHGSFFKKAFLSMARFVLKPFFKNKPENYIIKKQVKLCKYDNNKDCYRVGNFTGVTRAYGEKKLFNSFINVEFEGRTYPAPVGYDGWLTAFYGDYMILPPEEKRISNHHFVAYIPKNKVFEDKNV